MIRGLGRGAGGNAGAGAGAGARAGLHLAVQRRREGLDVGTRVQTLILRNSEQEGHRSDQIPPPSPHKNPKMAREAQVRRGTSSSSSSFMMGSMAREARAAGGARSPLRESSPRLSAGASTNGRKRNEMKRNKTKSLVRAGRKGAGGRRPATFSHGASVSYWAVSGPSWICTNGPSNISIGLHVSVFL